MLPNAWRRVNGASEFVAFISSAASYSKAVRGLKGNT